MSRSIISKEYCFAFKYDSIPSGFDSIVCLAVAKLIGKFIGLCLFACQKIEDGQEKKDL